MATTIHVPGTPAPQGSKNAYRHGNKTILVETSKKLPTWRKTIQFHAQKHCPQPLQGAIHLDIEFIMPRPKTLPKKQKHMTKKPDLDKLIRAVGDALTTIAYKDDNQINTITARKRYQHQNEQTGAIITIQETP